MALSPILPSVSSWHGKEGELGHSICFTVLLQKEKSTDGKSYTISLL